MAIQKRSIKDLDENCNSKIIHWSKSKRTVVSIFLPWVSAEKGLGELGHLECWVVKQVNSTSNATSDLLANKKITRQAILQNWAAIDFLLLLHSHECNELEGLGCLKLTSKSMDIGVTLKQIKGHSTRIQGMAQQHFPRIGTLQMALFHHKDYSPAHLSYHYSFGHGVHSERSLLILSYEDHLFRNQCDWNPCLPTPSILVSWCLPWLQMPPRSLFLKKKRRDVAVRILLSYC